MYVLRSLHGHALMFLQQNVLIDDDGHVRIAGLGAASVPSTVSGVDIDRFFHGAAPELIDPQRFGFVDTGSTKESDIYAFGIIAWQVSRLDSNSSGKHDEMISRSSLNGFHFPMRARSQGCVRCWRVTDLVDLITLSFLIPCGN